MDKILKNSWALFLGMGLIMLAHGYQGSLLGVRAVKEEFSLTATGFMLSGYYIGYFIGAMVTKTNGIATHIIHIRGIIILSFPTSTKVSTKKNAKIATHNLPITAEGTKSLSLAYLAITALQAKPNAVINPNKSP